MIETLVHTFDGTVCDAAGADHDEGTLCPHGKAVRTEWLLPEVPD